MANQIHTTRRQNIERKKEVIMNKEIKLKFKSIVRPSFASGAPARITQATIKINGVDICTGRVTQSVHDTDIKALGQKNALARAIHNAGPTLIPKELRIDIWEQFKNHSKATRQLFN